MKKIDIHCHVTSQNLENDLKKLEEKAKKYNLKKIFLLPTYFPNKGNGVSNYRLYFNIRKNNLFKMYLSFDNNYFWMAYNEMESILLNDREKIVGIKIYSGYQEIDFDGEHIKKLMALALQYKLPVVLHSGYVKGGGRKTAFNPISLKYFFSNYKDINFIIAHLGNPYLEEMKKLLRLKNVFTDISGLMEDTKKYTKKSQNYFMTLYNIFGYKKFLYGSDYPVQTYSQTNRILSGIPKYEKEKIQYYNAKELFDV